MDWRDYGTLLAVRRHGESSAIIEVFTASHGRHAGVVRGASSRKIAPSLQIGTELDVSWRARLDEHIGAYTIEPLRSRAGHVMADRLALSALGSVCALLSFSLPEREPQTELFGGTGLLLDMLGVSDAWPVAYLRWELLLLETLGFGLELSTCAATGATDDLAYVSPKTGRAVSRAAAGVWANRLLPFPETSGHEAGVNASKIVAGLRTTGHFLEKWVAPAMGDRPLPEARQRFVEVYSRTV